MERENRGKTVGMCGGEGKVSSTGFRCSRESRCRLFGIRMVVEIVGHGIVEKVKKKRLNKRNVGMSCWSKVFAIIS